MSAKRLFALLPIVLLHIVILGGIACLGLPALAEVEPGLRYQPESAAGVLLGGILFLLALEPLSASRWRARLPR